MKTNSLLRAILGLGLLAFGPFAQAQLTIPGADGSDGALAITSNTVVDLSQAISGVWSNNNSSNAGKGVYDSNKWAVVFKYSSVVISNGATLTFSNHPTHAPVVWLVTNNVTINGTISLDGQNGASDPVNLPEPGPGGFRGGAEAYSNLAVGGGFGPGGGDNIYDPYGNYNSGGARDYGNPQIIPLIGGSGGRGNNVNGAAGGGAILIAAANTITINGSLHANGGSGGNAWNGSAGAIRLVANQVLGNGVIDATFYRNGRIRVEANTASGALNVTPPTLVVTPVPVVLWPETNAPSVRIVSVSGQAGPDDPQAKLLLSGSDVAMSSNGPVAIVLQSSNFPTNGTVTVFVKPRNGGGGLQYLYNAKLVSGNSNVATWQVTTNVPVGRNVLQVRAVSN